MTFDAFLDGIKKLLASFGRKMTVEESELIYDFVSFIPDIAWGDVIKECIAKWETWPRNLPMGLKEAWYAFQGDRAAKNHHHKTDCQYCHDNTGIMFIENLEPNDAGYHDTAVCRCGHCKNWVGSMSEKTPEYKRDEIREKGWRTH
jgi:hypothetical protein